MKGVLTTMMTSLERTFNTVYTEYDKWRPTYVAELYDDIFAAKEINHLSKVLEIGIGTGQATLPILETKCCLTAIELGDRLAQFTQQKFRNYQSFTIKTMAFQDFECPSNTFDLIHSATAFHWIPEEIGYTKVFEILKPGGVFARFANHPYKDKGNEALHVAMQKVYQQYMPGSSIGAEYSESDAKNFADISRKYGFVDVSYKLYRRTRTFTARDYISLLGTYSDHIAIEEQKRIAFFDEIQSTIESHGGSITIYDTIDLQLARKP